MLDSLLLSSGVRMEEDGWVGKHVGEESGSEWGRWEGRASSESAPPTCYSTWSPAWRRVIAPLVAAALLKHSGPAVLAD